MGFIILIIMRWLFRWWWLLGMISGERLVAAAGGLGCNWGTRASHPLPPNIVVKLMKDNGFGKVKVFEAEPRVMKALGNSGIEVMVGIPNDLLADLASNVRVAEEWVSRNVSSYISQIGVDIRYVAVGNEPFLKTYKDTYLQTLFPALKNIQAALIRAGLGRDVKATIPFNADVYQTDNGLPSGGDFRSDIRTLMISIVKFLSENAAPLTINIYPFLSLNSDPHFPVDYAFFSGAASPVVDGAIAYSNVFEANFDTLIWALEKNGFSTMPVIVGEIGWPTDGDPSANLQYARRFYQGLLDRINHGKGTPKRPSPPPDIYLFALIDEDEKSLQPGNFERHWGIFYYDGTIKYQLDLNGYNGSLVPAKGVRYLPRQWCVMKPEASIQDPNLPNGINYACTYADCTSLGFGSSCGGLDVKSNASYAFNMYYQTMNQQRGSCEQFSNLAAITTIDPSRDAYVSGNCRFPIMIDVGRHEYAPKPRTSASAAAGDYISVIVALGLSLGFVIWPFD